MYTLSSSKLSEMERDCGFPFLYFDNDYIIENGVVYYILGLYHEDYICEMKSTGKVRYSHLRKLMEKNNLITADFPSKTLFNYTYDNFCRVRISELNKWIKNIQSDKSMKSKLFEALKIL